jgi:CheY-like chemotaxis protein
MMADVLREEGFQVVEVSDAAEAISILKAMPVDVVITDLRTASLGELGTRHADAGIDQHFAVRAGQDGDIPAGAFKHADIVAQLVRHDGRYRGAVLDQTDKAARLRERLAGGKPSSRGREGCTTGATEAEAPPRE